MDDFIAVIDDALPAGLCERVIAQFESSPQRRPGRAGGGVDLSKKRSTDLGLHELADGPALLHAVAAASSQHLLDYFRRYHFALIAPIGLQVEPQAGGAPVALTHENFEAEGLPRLASLMQSLYRLGPIQAQKYDAGVGNYNYWHCEVYPQAPHNEPLHRSLLFMFYLNDVAEGGHTEFFYQQRRIEPRRGRMVIAPAYFTHTHRGCTPVSGDKYILTSWVLLQRAETLYGATR